MKILLDAADASRAMPPMTRIRYTNHRGETAERRVIPLRLGHGTTEWHTRPQWLLEAFDLDKKANRTFALDKIEVLP